MTHKVLPSGYRVTAVMDFARNRKQMKTLCILSLIVTAASVFAGLLLHPIGVSWRYAWAHPWMWAVLLMLLIVYIPLHELTHGAFTWLFSHEPPTFGLKLPYAYCGSGCYFDKTSHAVIALAPVALFGILLFILERRVPDYWRWVLYATQISNLSGSVGDLYCVYVLFRQPKGTLVRDTGVRMTLYAPKTTT